MSLLPSLNKVQDEISYLNERLYPLRLRESHLSEILRLASLHLPRLQKHKELSLKDIQELEKWIARTKNNDGLINIIEALNELKKYVYPGDIKCNLYGLIQKILVEGAFKKEERVKKP